MLSVVAHKIVADSSAELHNVLSLYGTVKIQEFVNSSGAGCILFMCILSTFESLLP